MDLSAQVQDRQRLVRAVVPLLKARAARTGVSLAQLLSPDILPGKAPPSAAELILYIAAKAEAVQGKLEEADAAHSRELANDHAPRRARDKSAAALYREVIVLRGEVEAYFGDEGIEALSMRGETPREPALLERHARDLAGRLADGGLSLGEPKSSRVTFDRFLAAGALLSHCDDLKQRLAEVDAEVAKSKLTQEARAAALAEWQEKIPALFALCRSILFAAGDEEGAARISTDPDRSRRGEAEEGEAGDQESAEESAAPGES
jgi:hypothetical protein